MKKQNLWIMLFGITLLTACSKDQEAVQDQKTIVETQLSQEALDTKKLILDRGTKESEIFVDHETKSFIVGDVGFPFDWATNLKKIQANEKNYRTETTVTSANSNSITYFINKSQVPANYVNPIGWATYYWSIASKNINFREVSSASQADIVFTSGTAPSGSSAQARANFPSGNGNVGNIVQIFTNQNQPSDNNVRIVLMIHELGHSLGYEHSNANRSSTAVYLGSTTGTSQFHIDNTCGSVMRSTVFQCGWASDNRSKWSTSDKNSIDLLYGFDFNNPVNR
jgi:hypothetical protein